MKTTKLFWYVILMSLIYSLSSCSNNGTYVAPSLHEISAEFTSYVIFDSASSWVYQNDFNQILDTVTITKVLKDRRFHIEKPGVPGYYYNAIEMLMTSHETGMVKGEISAGSKYDANTVMTENYRLYFNNDRYFSIFIPKYPLGETQLLGINEGNYTNIMVHDTLFVNELKYTEVYETSVKDYHDGNDTVFMKFYIAKYFGLVKWTKDSSTLHDAWSLKSSSLLQTK